MSLKRRDIRDAVQDALLNTTDADDRVYTNRVKPIWQTEMPVLLVYTRNEAVTIWAEAPREYQRVLDLSVEVLIESDDDIDDDLDIIGEQVETALYQDHTLGEICHDVVLVGCDMTVDKDGSTQKGSLILNYQITYHTLACLDPDDLEWLERVDVQYDIVSGVTADNPYDIITGIGDV